MFVTLTVNECHLVPSKYQPLMEVSVLLQEFMKKLEEKRTELNKATDMGDALLAICHPDSITTIKHWITIIQARFEEVSVSSVISGAGKWETSAVEAHHSCGRGAFTGKRPVACPLHTSP